MNLPTIINRADARRTGDLGFDVSFEIFPPKSDEASDSLREAVGQLAALSPTFVSVTYGAGGSERQLSHRTLARLIGDTRLPTAAHLTCVGATRAEIDGVVDDFWRLGVRHFVALRGDAPAGAQRFEPHPDGYVNGADLVAGISARHPAAEISVSAYPERHPDSPTDDADLDMLQAKVDAGADRAITQFFFDNEHYLRYVDRVRARGIEIPIVPGILPIGDFGQAARFARRCGAAIPEWFARRFDSVGDDPTLSLVMGAAVAVEQVLDLADRGVDAFHFYTLNRAPLVTAICRLLGRPSVLARDAA